MRVHSQILETCTPTSQAQCFHFSKKKSQAQCGSVEEKRNMERALCRKDRKVEKIYLPPPESRHMQRRQCTVYGLREAYGLTMDTHMDGLHELVARARPIQDSQVARATQHKPGAPPYVWHGRTDLLVQLSETLQYCCLLMLGRSSVIVCVDRSHTLVDSFYVFLNLLKLIKSS